MLIRRSRVKHLTGEDLVAIDGGYLTGRRRERVYGHLATCPACHARVQEDREFTAMLRRHFVTGMDETRRTELIAHTLAAAARRRRNRIRRPTVVAAITVLVLFTMTILPSISEADSLLGDFVRFGQIEIKEQFEDPKPLAVPTVISSVSPSMPNPSFSVVEPSELPAGFKVASREVFTSGLVTLYFQNQAGNSLMLNQEPVNAGHATVDSNRPGDIVTLRDTSVLLVSDPRPGIVSAMFWERNGVGFGVLVVDEPSGGLLRQNALAMVDTIMGEQDVT